MLSAEFCEKVFRQLPEILDPRDREAANQCCMECYRDGFTVVDAVSFLMNLEHVNPDVPEDIALTNMARIQARYKK